MRISKTETEVLRLLTQEYLTPKKISVRRKTSHQATYKIIRSLKQKGLIGKDYKKVANGQCTMQPKEQNIRLHGQEFNIKLLWTSGKYRDRVEEGNLLTIDTNTVRLYAESIEIYSGKSFYGKDAQEATAKSFEYFNSFFIRLEHELGVILVKYKRNNIKLVKAHYAETNNELAKECNDQAERIRVEAQEDGKIWFTIDNSFNLNEAETMHPKTSKADMQETVQPFFNDLRKHDMPLPSEVWKILAETTRHEKELAAGLHVVVEMIKGQQPKKPEETPIEKPDYFG